VRFFLTDSMDFVMRSSISSSTSSVDSNAMLRAVVVVVKEVAAVTAWLGTWSPRVKDVGAGANASQRVPVATVRSTAEITFMVDVCVLCESYD